MQLHRNRRITITIAAAALLMAILNSTAAAQCDGWSPLGTDAPGFDVYAMTVFNGELIAAGDTYYGVQHWTGTCWEPLGGGIPWESEIYCLAIYNGQLIAGGRIEGDDGDYLDGIVSWDGRSWQLIGEDPRFNGATVRVLTVYNNELIVGGPFQRIGGQDTIHLARWDGTTWFPFSGFSAADNVYALSVFQGDLIVGGDFTSVGGHRANNIARYDGVDWAPLDGGVDGPINARVEALANYQADLIAGGQFTSAGGNPANYIARWDGAQWHSLGSGMALRGDSSESPYVSHLIVFNGDLIASGNFVEAGGRLAKYVARWTGSMWREMTSGLGWPPYTFALFEGDLIAGSNNVVVRWHDAPGECMGACCYQNQCILTTFAACDAAGGNFYGEGVYCDQVACVAECQTWQPMGAGFYSDGDDFGAVKGFTFYKDQLVAAGRFSIVGQPGLVNVASWDGTSWQTIGGGVRDQVYAAYAAASDGENLYLAGGSKVLRFDGAAWQPLGDLFLQGQAYALAFYHDELIVAGSFGANGTQPLNRIARWDGSAWQPLGSGVEGAQFPSIDCLALYNDELIVGGNFDTAGGQPALNIAAWNGKTWHALGDGVTKDEYASVRALVEFNGLLIAGGEFTQAGGQDALSFAAWDGTNWQPGFGSDGSADINLVDELTVFHNHLIAAGIWGDYQNPVRQWNDSLKIWQPMKPGTLQQRVNALATSDHELFAGGSLGDFSLDGPIIKHIAHWSDCLGPCRTDFNADGTIDAADLMMIIDGWGPCADPGNCPRDVAPPNGDGVINVDDLLSVLITWGPCP